jgi:hypothetical protein
MSQKQKHGLDGRRALNLLSMIEETDPSKGGPKQKEPSDRLMGWFGFRIRPHGLQSAQVTDSHYVFIF